MHNSTSLVVTTGFSFPKQSQYLLVDPSNMLDLKFWHNVLVCKTDLDFWGSVLDREKSIL